MLAELLIGAAAVFGYIKLKKTTPVTDVGDDEAEDDAPAPPKRGGRPSQDQPAPTPPKRGGDPVPTPPKRGGTTPPKTEPAQKPPTEDGDPTTIRTMEKAAVGLAFHGKPQTYPQAPTAGQRARGDRPQWVYDTNVAYWTLYCLPTAQWVTSGHAPAPWVIPDKTSPWAAVWDRMAEYRKTLDAPAPVDANPLNTDADEADAKQFGLTKNEKAAADAMLILKPESVDSALVPAPYDARQPAQKKTSYWTNAAWWTVYRAADSEWVQAGNAPAPVKLASSKHPLAPAWNRINAYILARVAAGA